MDKDALPGKIPDIEKTEATPALGDQITEKHPGSSFQDYMNQKTTTPIAEGPEGTTAQAPSPYQVVQPQSAQLGTPTMDSLQNQSQNMSDSLNDLNSQLNTKNLSLNQSQKYLLRNKLSEANTNVRVAATKAGVEVGPPPSSTTKLNPVQRFLSYVSDSQTQMAAVQTKLKQISADGKSLSPGEMLLIQVKMNKAQQALEYSSVLLGKAVEDIKTLFNVQI